MIAEKYRGIRPAPGYPAQPDHTEKGTLFDLLEGERQIGVKLTESFAMWPGASVCGLYFSHPDSHYFGVGKIERDQVEDYAKRKGWTPEEAEKMAGSDPQLRSARRGAHRGGVIFALSSPPVAGTTASGMRDASHQNENTGEVALSGVGIGAAKRRGRVDLTQNAPNKTAPTNTNTAQTATTLRFNVARPTSVLPSSLNVTQV